MAVVEQASQTTQAIIRGDTGQLNRIIEQCIAFCVEGGKSILVALLIYIVGRFVIRLLNGLLTKMLERRKVDPTIQTFLQSFVNILLTILLIITVVSALGVNTTSFAALLASAGLAFGMAMSGNLQNLAGGLIILLFKPYKVGDVIESQGQTGTVKAIQIFHTILHTADGKLVFLPNGSTSSNTIVNYTNDQRRLDLTVSVEYGTDVDLVRQTVLEIVKKDKRVLNEAGREPFVELHTLAASSVDFVVRLWVDGADYWPTYFDMQRAIYTAFNEKDIRFPFPQMTVHQA